MISIIVQGDPRSKGSMTAVRAKDGRLFMRNRMKSTKVWQSAVEKAAKAAMALEGFDELFDKPVRVELMFFMRRGKTVKRSHPSIPPDVDKLCRAVLDALQGTVLKDDARVVELAAAKVYGDEPGVQINVMEVEV